MALISMRQDRDSVADSCDDVNKAWVIGEEENFLTS
jgi:hypothetical protein